MIKVLSKNVSDKIAAGEVIERPISIVKELVENSIDSGATNIAIEIKNGGKTFIRVTDNGCGIPGDEVETAFLRHATSKIEAASDLETISSLGFRGEALASIAAVTRTTLITKTIDSKTGRRITIYGGETIENKAIGCPDGTTIIVTDLFYNTPARRDFLKADSAESSMYLDYCRKYKVETDKNIYIYENNNKTLARKKSSVSVMFKQLYRDELVSKNITDGFDPIRVPKAGEHEIKALQDDEVMVMLDSVSTGAGLTKHEYSYWEKTKKRDKAILVVFLTYGLRLSELQQLNVSSFNFSRGEFKIYRKRGKEAIMPMNKSVTMVINDYINNERAKDDQLDPENKDALFLSLQGKRMTERQIRELVKKYTSIAMKTSRKAGYSPHKLRATAATSLIGRGNSIYDVAALLDHEQVTTTQLYAKHKANVKRDLVHDMEWETERQETADKSKKDDE